MYAFLGRDDRSAALTHELLLPIPDLLRTNEQVVQHRPEPIGGQEENIGDGEDGHGPRKFAARVERHEDEKSDQPEDGRRNVRQFPWRIQQSGEAALAGSPIPAKECAVHASEKESEKRTSGFVDASGMHQGDFL